MKTKHISWDMLKNYWIETNHFSSHPNKNFQEIVTQLGPFKIECDDPTYQAYGLFDKNKLIGVTQLIEWSPEKSWIRFRTINIRKDYRKQGLAWKLLLDALNEWNYEFLFGWLRQDYYHTSFFSKFTRITPFMKDGYSHIPHCAILANIEKIKLS